MHFASHRIKILQFVRSNGPWEKSLVYSCVFFKAVEISILGYPRISFTAGWLQLRISRKSPHHYALLHRRLNVSNAVVEEFCQHCMNLYFLLFAFMVSLCFRLCRSSSTGQKSPLMFFRPQWYGSTILSPYMYRALWDLEKSKLCYPPLKSISLVPEHF